NYTTKLRNIKRYVDFKKKVQSPQDKGDVRIKTKRNIKVMTFKMIKLTRI
ncbi:unnamed protein product, partial [marine sediment metagenome]